MDQHLTLSEARALTGKSETTLKRLIREITANADHPDRACLLPSPAEIERRRAAKEPYAWRIDRECLLRRFPRDTRKGGTSFRGTPHDPAAAPPDLMLQVLREQLSSKDQQIRTLETQLDRKDEQIANLSERMRESNVLMRELQQRLAIALPPSASEMLVESAPSQATAPATFTTSPESPASLKPKGKAAGSEPRVNKQGSSPRRGFFRRMFRPIS